MPMLESLQLAKWKKKMFDKNMFHVDKAENESKSNVIPTSCDNSKFITACLERWLIFKCNILYFSLHPYQRVCNVAMFICMTNCAIVHVCSTAYLGNVFFSFLFTKRHIFYLSYLLVKATLRIIPNYMLHKSNLSDVKHCRLYVL